MEHKFQTIESVLGIGFKTVALQKQLTKKDTITAEHSEVVGKLCASITQEMIRQKKDIHFSMLEAYIAGSLHDIGKLKMGDEILKGKHAIISPKNNPSIRIHPLESYKILNENGFESKIAEAALSHHERWDGSGYPNALKGNQISELANLIGIVDTFSALTQKRTYEEKRTEQEALEILKKDSKLFNPDMLEIFFQFMEKHSNTFRSSF